MNITINKQPFLEGGGAMGKLIRAEDWTQTSLGDPEFWPQPLKTMVNIMLNNPLAMYIAWGKDFTQIYNDGYRPILGTHKHPDALGKSTQETFSEIWDTVHPMFTKVMAGESVSHHDYMLPLNRNGYFEDCYFDFAYIPIKLESGEVGGIMVTINETTDKKKIEDDLKANRHDLEFIIEASQLGTFEYNPITNKISANDRLRNWFGFSAENHNLDYAFQSIISTDKERVTKAIQRALEFSSGGKYDIEYSIVDNVSNKEIIVHAKGKAWFNEDKIAYRLNGTLEDVTEKVLARKKIEESERSLRLMILQAPIAIAIFRSDDYKVEIANKYALQIWGRSEKEVLGISLFDAMPELLPQGIRELLDEVVSSGQRYATDELALQFKKNEVFETAYVNFSFEALFDSDGSVNGIMVIGYDVTSQVDARKKIEASEQRIRALVESAPFPIGVFVGEEMRISLANQSIMDTWGKGNDVIGKLYSDILPELENQQVYEQIRDVMRTGIPFHAQNQNIDIVKNGKLHTYYFNYSLTPLLDATGNVTSVMNTAADVTELHRVKYKIEQSERRFKDVVKQAPLGIVILSGPNYIVEIANETYLQIIARTEDEFLGYPLFEALPELEDAISAILADIYATGKAFYSYEFPVFLKRGDLIEECFFNLVYHPLKEYDEITSIMVVATEVTATVKAKHLIEENEEKLQLVIQGSELGVYDVNLKNNTIISSSRCYEILGISDNETLSYADFMSFVHPEDIDIRNNAYAQAVKNGVLHYQSRIIWRDLSVHWMDVKGKIFFDADNQPERILGTVRDITEERSFQQQILEREEKFRHLADSMPQQVWTADPNGRLNYFNQTVFDYSGFTLKQLRSNGWLEMVHPDDRKENLELWNQAIISGNDFLMEHRFRKHNGEYRWQLSHALPQKDKDGVIKMWVGSSTDIQEQKMFTTELENMVQRRTIELQDTNINLEKMNKELQSFVYISSHDLQEPLRKIQTFSSRILETEYANLSDTGQKYFSRMQKSAYRMQSLIQDLIAYSRTNIRDTNYETIDLLDIIEDVQEALSEELEENNVMFALLEICTITIIPVQFTQVIHNLISNSIKFARTGHPLRIEIACKENVEGSEIGANAVPDKKYCHIRYKDNGIGFETQYNEKIFEVFQRLHSKDEYTGTGIGLAIVKRIIDNHEGVIVASGNHNEGAIFDIYLPVHHS